MAALNKAIDKQSLKALSPLGKLSHDKIDDIIRQSRVENLPANRIVFRQGEDDGQTIYLLSGQIELSVANKTRKQLIKGKSVDAKFPLADQIPRPATARTKTASSLLYIDSSLLEILLNDNPSGEYEVTEINVAEHATDWMMRFLQSRAFLKLPTQNIQKVLMCMEEIHAGKGDSIVEQGEEGEYYYIIKSGSCAVSRRPAEKAEEIRLAKLAEGDGFGEEALITNNKRNATVKMLDSGTLMRLKKDDFLRLLVTPLTRNVHLNSLKSNLYKNSVLLDIRTNNEFKNGSLDNAKHIPFSMLRLRTPTLDARKQYLIYAENKDHANAAAFLLAQHGIDCMVILGSLQNTLTGKQQATAFEIHPQHTIIQTDISVTDPANESQCIQIDPVQVIGDQSSGTPPNTPPSSNEFDTSIKSEAADLAVNHNIDDHAPGNNLQEEAEKLRTQATLEAERMLAEAEAIRQSAIQEATRLRDKIEKEETIKLRNELEDTRARAESAIRKSEQLAEQIRQQAEQESSQIRQQALDETDQLRHELEQLREQETQMKIQLETELLSLRQQAAEQARIDAEIEAENARIAAEQAAEIARNLALREAEETRAIAEQQAEEARLQAEKARNLAQREADETRATAEQQAEEARSQAEKARNLALREAEATRAMAEQEAEEARNQAEKARTEAIREAEETRRAAEQAAANARAAADRLTDEAKAIEQEAEQARRNAELEAEAIRQAALEEANRIKQTALQESEQIKKNVTVEATPFISHDNVFNLDDEISPTIKPVQPYADEASVALEMAKEIKAKLVEVEEQRVVNAQTNISKPVKNQAQITKLKGKVVLEGEEDIFIFKEPKELKPGNSTIEQAVTQITAVNPKQAPTEPDIQDIAAELPVAELDIGDVDSFEDLLKIKPGDDIPSSEKNKKSILALVASIFLVITLSLVAYTTKIQINFTEVGALVNQESIEKEEEKARQQARKDFRKKISRISK